MLRVNRIYGDGATCWRLVALKDGYAYLFPLGSRRIQFDIRDTTELSEKIQSGQITELKDPYADVAATQKESLIERAKANYRIIEPIVSNLEILCNKNSRASQIKSIAQTNKVTRQKVCRLLKNWLEKGLKEEALVPGYGKNTGKRNPTRKNGRVSATSENPPISEAIRSDLERAYRKYLLKEEHCSVPQAYRQFRVDFKKEHPEIPESQHPSFGQFQYHYRRNHSASEIVRKQTRPMVYDKDVRPLSGSVYDIVGAPGDRYEIDSTVADVTLVSSLDRNNIIGRPTLYCVTDTYTGLIVGVHVSIDSAQYKGAADAIYNAITDKVCQCSRLGIEIKPEEWPAFGLPSKIVADNAELQGPRIETFAAQYQTQIDNTVPYRADQKGTVEMGLGLIQSILRNQTPGVPEKPNSKKAGYREKRTDAVLTLRAYRKMVCTAALQANNRMREKTPPGFESGVMPTPLGIWRWAEAKGNVHLTDPGDLKKLRLSLLPMGKCTVSRRGIKANGIRYQCEKTRKEGLQDRDKGHSKSTTGRLAYDPSNITQAWYYPEPEAKPYLCWECELASESKYLEGLSLTEAKIAIDLRKKAKKEAKAVDIQQSTRWTAKRQEILEEATSTAPQSTETDSEKLKKIAVNRRNEKKTVEKSESRISVETRTKTEERMAKGQPDKTNESQPADMGIGPMGFPLLVKDIPD